MSKQSTQKDSAQDRVMLDVLDLSGKKLEQCGFDPQMLDVALRPDILHQVVVWQLAKRRTGCHHTKGRSEVAGSNRKIRAQKGTGRARAGSSRAPHFRGGGVVFGPKVRDHSHKLNKKVRKLGLRIAVSDRARNARIVLVDGISTIAKSAQVQEFVGKVCERSTRALIIADTTLKSAANLVHVNSLAVAGLNVYDILRHDLMILDRSCVDAFVARLA